MIPSGLMVSDADVDTLTSSTDEDLEGVVDPIDRMHRISLLKNLLLNHLHMEKAWFESMFQKKIRYVASYIDSQCSELYLSLQKDIRSHNLLRKEGHIHMSNTSLELVEYITDRIFFYLNRLRFAHKKSLNKDITIDDLSMDKLYGLQLISIDKCMASIVSKHKDDLLVSMESDPYSAYRRFFSIFPRYKVSTYVERFYIQQTIDRVNVELSELQSFADNCIIKARVGHIAQGYLGHFC